MNLVVRLGFLVVELLFFCGGWMKVWNVWSREIFSFRCGWVNLIVSFVGWFWFSN